MTTNYINELMQTLQNYVKTNPEDCRFNYHTNWAQMNFNGNLISIKPNKNYAAKYLILIGDDEAINENDLLDKEMRQLYQDISDIASRREIKEQREKRNNICKNFLDGLKDE